MKVVHALPVFFLSVYICYIDFVAESIMGEAIAKLPFIFSCIKGSCVTYSTQINTFRPKPPNNGQPPNSGQGSMHQLVLYSEVPLHL